MKEIIADLISRYLPRRGPTREGLLLRIKEQSRYIRELQLDSETAINSATELALEISKLRRQLLKIDSSPLPTLYSSVGLDRSAPDWLIKSTRREFRRHLHPDTKNASEKKQATAQFQEAENAFELLYRARGLR